MNLLSKTVCVIAVSVASASVMAAESTDLSVAGAISPGACLPSFSGDGTLDYGAIDPSIISANGYSRLAEKSMIFSINCSAHTKVAFVPQSQRGVDSIAGGTTVAAGEFAKVPVSLAGANSNYQRSYAAGLNFDASGNKVGGVGLNIKNGASTVDGDKNVDILVKSGSGDFGVKPTDLSIVGNTYAWGVKGSVEPLAFKTLSSVMSIQAYLNKKNELDLSQEINLDGMVTFELVYL